MTITPIYENKKDYMELLLLADEQEDMINRYLDRGDMFVLTEDDTTGAESPGAEQTATVPADPAAAAPANSDCLSSAPLVCSQSAPTNPQPHSTLAECVVTKEADGIYEIKNLAVAPPAQHKGYGKKLVQFLFSHYTDCRTMYVGTGDSPLTVPFYKSCGFRESHRLKDYITRHYENPIFEAGKLLTDTVYLRWDNPDWTADSTDSLPPHLRPQSDSDTSSHLKFSDVAEADYPALTDIMTRAFNDDTRMHTDLTADGPAGYRDGSLLRKLVNNPKYITQKFSYNGKIAGAYTVIPPNEKSCKKSSATNCSDIGKTSDCSTGRSTERADAAALRPVTWELDMLFLDPELKNQDIGTKVWEHIESTYSDAERWIVVTPNYSLRNHHFYVKKCGFRLIKKSFSSDLDGVFTFEKRLPRIFLFSGPCGCGKSTLADAFSKKIAVQDPAGQAYVIHGDYFHAGFMLRPEEPDGDWDDFLVLRDDLKNDSAEIALADGKPSPDAAAETVAEMVTETDIPQPQISWSAILSFNWDCILSTTENALRHGMDVVIDYVVEDELPRVRELARELHAPLYYIVLTASEETLRSRITGRGDVEMIDRSLFLRNKLEHMPENEGHLFDNTGMTVAEEIQTLSLDIRRFRVIE